MKYTKSFEDFNGKQITSPEINSIVKFSGWRFNKDYYPCDVYIISGQYLSGGRVSNFWYWKRILPNGDLSEEEHGYGDFYTPLVDMTSTYTPEEIKEIYPAKYKEYELSKDAKKYNI
jgi:hypothetical protein